MNEVIAGIDIGGTKIAIALETFGGEKIAARRLPTEAALGADATIGRASQALIEMLDESRVELISIGIGCPSPLDLEKGLVMSPSNLPGWNEFPIVKIFREKFRVPVALDNDANAAALGEYHYGAGRGLKNIFFVTVSTGIGGGIIIDGEIHHGVAAGAGELGHTIVQPGGFRCNCGSSGCLETISAGVHIARRARERLATGEASLMREMLADIRAVTAKTVVEAARAQDRLALEIWDDACRFLAIGIGNVVTILAPEAVIVGGGIAAAGDFLFQPLRRLVPEFVSMIPKEKIKILPAELGSESGVCGTLVLARKAYSNVLQTYEV